MVGWICSGDILDEHRADKVVQRPRGVVLSPFRGGLTEGSKGHKRVVHGASEGSEPRDAWLLARTALWERETERAFWFGYVYGGSRGRGRI